MLILVIAICIFVKIDITPLIIEQVSNEIAIATKFNSEIDKIYLKILPLSIEIKNLNLYYEHKGKNILHIKKIKIYLSLWEILSREIILKRIVIFDSNFEINREFLNQSIENITDYINTPVSTPFNLRVKSVEIDNLSGIIHFENSIIDIKNFRGRALIKPESEIKFLSNVKLVTPSYPNIDTNIKTEFKIKKERIILNELKLFDNFSLVKTDGYLDSNKFLGEFLITGKLFINSFLSFLGIKDKSSGQISLEGKIFLKDNRDFLDKIFFDLSFNASFSLERLMQILKVSEKLEGYTEIEKGRVYGPLSDIEISAKAKQTEGNILGIKTNMIKSNLYFRNGKLEFRESEIKIYDGKAKAYVWISLPEVVNHHVSIELEGLKSSGIFEIINWNPGISEGKVNGFIVSEGRVFSPKGSFTYQRIGTKPDDLRGRINLIRGDFNSNGQVYEFKTLDFQMDKTKVSATGYIDIKGNYLEFKYEGSTTDINELLIPYQRSFSGDAYFTGLLHGKVDDPEIKLNFNSKSLKINIEDFISSIKQEPLLLSNLTGNITYKRNLLLLNNVYNQDNISINGRINFPKAKSLFDFNDPYYSINFRVKNIFISDLYLKAINEHMNFSLALNGTITERDKIEGKLNLYNISLKNQKIIDSLESFLKYDKECLIITDSKVVSNGEKISFSGYINFDGKVDISGHSKYFNFSKFIKEYTDKIGAKNLHSSSLKNLRFKIEGLYKEPKILAESELLIRGNSGKHIDGVISLNLINSHLTVKSSVLKTAKFELNSMIRDKKWDISGNFNSTRVDSVLSLFSSNLPEDLVLLINGDFKSSIVDNKFNATLNLNRLFTRLYGIALNNKTNINLRFKDRDIYIEPITLLGQSTEITIRGKITDYYDILIEGFTDLRPFKALLNVDSLKGRADALVYIYENRKNPEIAGEINIKNGQLTLRKDIPSLNELNAVISFNEDRLIIENSEGKFSEGNLNLRGTVYLKDLNIHRFALTGNFSDVRWIFSPRSWAYFDGEVYLDGTKEKPRLSGNININRGIYSERLDLVNLAMHSGKGRTVITKDDWFSNLSLNLKIQTDNFTLNNNLAELSLNGDLVLRGSLINPSLLGWINAKDGWIYFRDNRFQVLRFIVQFNDPEKIRPFLNISARTNVAQYNINLALNGFIDQFNLILSSNPPLSENELLNILVLGQQDSTARGTFSGSSEAASFVTGQIQGLIEERVREITGLDLLTVEPGFSKMTGSIAPRVTIGKKLMDGRLNVTYSTSTGTTAEQIIKVEYIIKKGVSIIGLRDEIGGLSGGIKFRFEFH